MSFTLERPNAPQRRLVPNMKLWTAEECETLCEQGLIKERYELIEGIIVEEMRTTPLHSASLGLVLDALAPLFGLNHIRAEGTIRLSEAKRQRNLLVPDVVVVKGERRDYLKSNPLPHDILLVVEVADSSLRTDLTTKAGLYAGAGIQEYWALDVKGRKVIVHREPTPKGYQSVTTYGDTESLSPLALPDKFIPISELLEQTLPWTKREKYSTLLAPLKAILTMFRLGLMLFRHKSGQMNHLVMREYNC